MLEREHVAGKDPNILNKINTIKKELNGIYEEELEKKAKFIKQRYYEYGPKTPGVEAKESTGRGLHI